MVTTASNGRVFCHATSQLAMRAGCDMRSQPAASLSGAPASSGSFGKVSVPVEASAAAKDGPAEPQVTQLKAGDTVYILVGERQASDRGSPAW